MGRGHNNSDLSKLAAERELDSNYQEILRKGDMLVGRWEMKISKDDILNQDNFSDIVSAKARGLSSLVKDSQAQCQLVKVAQDTQLIMDIAENQAGMENIHFQAKNLNSRAKEIFVLCHNGFVENMVNKHAYRLRGDDIEYAKEVLRNVAWEALSEKGIKKYNIDSGLKPLTFMQHWIRANIRKTIEEDGGEGGVRLKSKMLELGAKVESTAKELSDAGRPVTINEIAFELDVDRKDVAHVYPWAVEKTSRLDAPIKTDDDKTTLGALTIDSRQSIENTIVEDDTENQIRAAINSLESPLHRKVIELFHGFGDNDRVEQKDLSDGVYKDSEGNLFSAESSVISNRENLGISVTKKSQRELNDLFAAGDLVFIPGTPEAYELSRVAMDDYSPDEEYLAEITRDNGIPPTSGSVQALKRKAEQLIRESPHLQSFKPQYRGDNILENSEIAREKVRRALLEAGHISKADVAKLQAARASRGGKSPLRKLAEQYNLVDPEKGRLDEQAVKRMLDSSRFAENDDSIDYADLMSS